MITFFSKTSVSCYIFIPHTLQTSLFLQPNLPEPYNFNRVFDTGSCYFFTLGGVRNALLSQQYFIGQQPYSVLAVV